MGEVIPLFSEDPLPERQVIHDGEICFKTEEAYPAEPDKVGKYFVRVENNDQYRISYFPSELQVNYSTRSLTKDELGQTISDLKAKGFEPGGIL